jgi:hypothetical protein
MERMFVGLLFVLAAIGSPAIAGDRAGKACQQSCVAVTQKAKGYVVQVREVDGSMNFNQYTTYPRGTVAARDIGESQIIDLTAGIALRKDGSGTSTQTTSTPLAGGGAVIVVTVWVDGVIISQTVIIVNAQGTVVQIQDMEQ